MKCKCGYPIPPQIKITKTGLLGQKEVPNITEWTCKICGEQYILKSFKGKITI